MNPSAHHPSAFLHAPVLEEWNAFEPLLTGILTKGELLQRHVQFIDCRTESEIAQTVQVEVVRKKSSKNSKPVSSESEEENPDAWMLEEETGVQQGGWGTSGTGASVASGAGAAPASPTTSSQGRLEDSWGLGSGLGEQEVEVRDVAKYSRVQSALEVGSSTRLEDLQV